MLWNISASELPWRFCARVKSGPRPPPRAPRPWQNAQFKRNWYSPSFAIFALPAYGFFSCARARNAAKPNMSVNRSVRHIGRRKRFTSTPNRDAAAPSKLLQAGMVGPPSIVEVQVTIQRRPKLCGVNAGSAWLFRHSCKENIPHAPGKKVTTSDVSRRIATEDQGHASRALEFVAHRRLKNRRLFPVCGQSEFPVLHCEAVGSLKFGTGIFPGILREVFCGRFQWFKSLKNLWRTVLESQRGAGAAVLQTIKSDFRARRGDKMICVARLEMCTERYNVAVGRGKLIRGARLRVAIPAGERLWVNFSVRRGLRVRRELASQIEVRNLVRQTEGIAGTEIAEADHRESLLGKAQQRGAIAEVRAVVCDDGKAAVFADKQTQGVLDLLAVVEPARRLHFLEQCPFAQLVVVKIAVPQKKIVHAAHQPAASDHIVIGGPVDAEAAAWARRVSCDSAGQHNRAVVVEAGVRHPERLENVFFREPRKRLACRAADHYAHQKVIGVAVEEFIARSEVKRFLSREQIEQFACRMDVLGVPASEKEQAQDVSEAAGVMQHFAQRDGFAVRGNFWDILADVVIEREESLLGGENHAGCRELLGDAAHVKNGFRRESNAKLEASGSVAFLVNKVSVSDDSERAAGRAGIIIGGEDLVYAAFERLIFLLFPRHREGGCEYNDR